jgi:rhomboid-like protein
LIIGGCCAFAKTCEIPAKEDRMFPKLNPAGAAVLGLISINLGVFALWRFPPAWKMLNRYFLSVPMYPRALSMVGSIFSHQQFKHLAINSFILFMLGPMRESSQCS